jgi:hypothetical protein
MSTPERAFYRLTYPLAFRPTLQVGKVAYVVVDLSEQGIRVVDTGLNRLEPGDQVVGTLSLPTDDRLEIEGSVVRVEPPHAALILSKGVPFAIMLAQQRFLQRRFVGWR